MDIKIAIIVGTNRPARIGRKVADWAINQLPQQEGVVYELIDIAEVNLPFLNEPKLPSAGDYAHEHTRKWSEKIAGYDGYILVTGEYNHGYPASLKNALDTIYAEWQKKPVAFVGYGALGAARSIEQLVSVTAQIGMVPLPSTSINIIDAWAALDEQGNVKPENIRGNFAKLTDNLLWWVIALKTART